jgi:DNA-binding MarR family transcriptional regulator
VTTRWLDDDERAAWMQLAAVVELLPGVMDSQLRQAADLTHFEYWVLSMLSEAPDRTLRMTALASRTNSTLPRLSHVVHRLECRGLVERLSCAEDRRVTNARLTDAGWEKVVATGPLHLQAVREHVFDPLDPGQVAQLATITAAMLSRLDPDAVVTADCRRETHNAAPVGG